MSVAPQSGYPPQPSPRQFIEDVAGFASGYVWLCQSTDWDGGFAHDYYAKLGSGSAHYYSQCLMRQNSTRRSNENAETAWTFVLDDVGVVPSITGAKLDVQAIRMFGVPPSYIVETSHGNYQFGYVLMPMCSDMDKWRCFLAAMKAHPTWGIGLDGAGDRAHLYRLPTGKNPKNGFETKLYREYKLICYSLEDLAKGFGVDISPAAVDAFLNALPSKSGAEQVPLVTLQAMLSHIPNGPLFDDRATWTKMAHAMASCSNDYPGEARDLFIEWSENRIDSKGRPARVTPGEAARVWDTLDDDHQATVGSIRKWVEELNPGNYQARASVGEGFGPIDEARAEALLPKGYKPAPPPPQPKGSRFKTTVKSIRSTRPVPDVY